MLSIGSDGVLNVDPRDEAFHPTCKIHSIRVESSVKFRRGIKDIGKQVNCLQRTKYIKTKQLQMRRKGLWLTMHKYYHALST